MTTIRQQIGELLAEIPIDLGGGSSVRKGAMMAWLIRWLRLSPTVDIGVYRGRSLFPQALAHRRFTGGVVYGVDPWSAAEFVQQDLPTELVGAVDRFLGGLDLDGVYQACLGLRRRFGLEPHCELIRKTSACAAREFAARNVRFGLVHIDGNHDYDKVLADITAYLPLLRPGGILVLDDISWPTVERASEALRGRALQVHRRVSPDKADDFAVYVTGRSRLKALALGRLVAHVADRPD